MKKISFTAIIILTLAACTENTSVKNKPLNHREVYSEKTKTKSILAKYYDKYSFEDGQYRVAADSYSYLNYTEFNEDGLQIIAHLVYDIGTEILEDKFRIRNIYNDTTDELYSYWKKTNPTENELFLEHRLVFKRTSQNVIEEKRKDENGHISQKVIHYYNDEGLETSTEDISYTDFSEIDIHIKYKYTYDDDNNIVSSVQTDLLNKETTTTNVIILEKDNNKKATKILRVSDDTTYATYTYTYYD